ncbi:hypothetical protein [Arthrobacter sp. NPDC057013]|uniref:hypothetical protein n=1 Tax=Arthrobacter sp. NPDC057013 TaxID=3345999 RepID=UPI0036437035
MRTPSQGAIPVFEVEVSSRRCLNIGNGSLTRATVPSETSTARTPGSSPRSASTYPIGSTRMLRPTDTGGAWHTPATYTLFSIARGAFKASYCSSYACRRPGRTDQQHLRAASARDLASSGNRRS